LPKVAVIIPTYNRANLIGEGIQSVLHQTFTDFEIIVVDDGSSDNTKDVVARYTDPRIRYEYRENNGVSAARNAGAKVCNAEYVAFLDSDDIYLENALEKMIKSLDAHKQVGYSYGQANIMKVGKTAYRIRKSHVHESSVVLESKEQLRELIFHKPMNVSTSIIRHSCFDEIGGFNEDLWFAEDHHLFVRLSKKYPSAYIAEPVTNMRFHSIQLQREVKPGREKAFLSILQEIFEDPTIAPEFEDLKGEAYCYNYRTWIANSAYEMDMKLFRQYMRKAIGFYPQVLLKPEILMISYKYVSSLLPNRVRLGLRDLKRRFRYTLEQQE
jgi:glycosyltransferase involved in cell wall biosynthesis